MTQPLSTPILPAIPFTNVKANLHAHVQILLDYRGEDWLDMDAWAEVHRQLIDGHATRSAYRLYGCKCWLCGEAQRRYSASRVEQQRASNKRWRERKKAERLQMVFDLEDEDEL